MLKGNEKLYAFKADAESLERALCLKVQKLHHLRLDELLQGQGDSVQVELREEKG